MCQVALVGHFCLGAQPEIDFFHLCRSDAYFQTDRLESVRNTD